MTLEVLKGLIGYRRGAHDDATVSISPPLRRGPEGAMGTRSLLP
jgi:hypothetical protein